MLVLACVQLKKQLVKSSLTDLIVNVLCFEAGVKLGQNNPERCSSNFHSKVRGKKKKNSIHISGPSLAQGRAECKLHHFLTKHDAIRFQQQSICLSTQDATKSITYLIQSEECVGGLSLHLHCHLALATTTKKRFKHYSLHIYSVTDKSLSWNALVCLKLAYLRRGLFKSLFCVRCIFRSINR